MSAAESIPVLEAARSYAERGFAVVPLIPRRKRPVDRHWTALRLGGGDLEQRFGGDQNVGLILGEASKWLVDVDLDCDEARELAPEFLPPTPAVTGRGRRPGTHWWYRCPGAVTKKHADPESGSMIVELRSSGAQTVVGPSVHPDGDRYDVLEAEPAEVTAEQLRVCVAALAKAVLKRRGHLKPTADSFQSAGRTGSGLSNPKNNRSDLDSRGESQTALASGYGAQALARECREIARTLEGSRNDRLNTGAFRMGQLVGGGELDEHQAEHELVRAGLATGLKENEVRATVRSGLRSGMQSPRSRAERSIESSRADSNLIDPPAGQAGQVGGDDAPAGLVAIDELLERHPRLRPPLIDGLLRQGETMNIVAAPKSKKSWLVLDLALAVALGEAWLGVYGTVPGKVLIIDNELHAETSAFRVNKVLAARGYRPEQYRGRVFITNLRGRLCDLYGLRQHLAGAAEQGVKLIVLDAFYRFMPKGESENDNATVAGLYNEIDRIASELGVGVVLIHHTSKGGQGGKTVTDVGAGAGSQSRAADTHLVLRDHEEEDAIVLDAVVRSWRPIEPRCLRFEFPIWVPDPDLDPTQLAEAKKSRRSKPASDASELKAPKVEISAEEFLERFIDDEPVARDEIERRARVANVPVRLIRACMNILQGDGRVTRVRPGGFGPWLVCRSEVADDASNN